MGESSGGSSGRTSRSLNLTTAGVTLLGVILGIGTTVGLGVGGHWAVRVAAASATAVVLVVLVKLSTATGRGPVTRVANWMIGEPGRGRQSPD